MRPCGPSGLHKPSPFTSTYKEDDVYLFIFATFTILMQNIQPQESRMHTLNRGNILLTVRNCDFCVSIQMVLYYL